MAKLPKVDVVTIGAGLTAGILAQQLTTAGKTVVSLEQGPERHTETNFAHDHDELRYQIRRDMMVDLQSETWTWRPAPKDVALPMRRYGAFNPGKGVGGASVHWAAQNWRFFPTDFRYRSNVIERYGESKLPSGSMTKDWGITYEEMEPYYDKWEYDVGVSGKAGNLKGQEVKGGNVFEGPRSREYPLPPLPTSMIGERFTKARVILAIIRSLNPRRSFPSPTRICRDVREGHVFSADSVRGTAVKSMPRRAPSRRMSRWPSRPASTRSGPTRMSSG